MARCATCLARAPKIAMSFREALRVVGQLRDEGVIQEYAVGGAMAMVFWSEPVATYDLDVFVLMPEQAGPLVSLAPLYEWSRQRGFAIENEHIVISGVPVQIIPAPNELTEAAVREAVVLDLEGLPVRVVSPEYLIALYLEPSARTRKRMERVAALLEGAPIDRSRLESILGRYGLSLPEQFS